MDAFLDPVLLEVELIADSVGPLDHRVKGILSPHTKCYCRMDLCGIAYVNNVKKHTVKWNYRSYCV